MENRENKDMESDFDSVYEKYYGVILKHIAYLTGSIHAAEDISQEVFMRFYNSPPSHSNTIAWLCRVANNLAYNYLRDEKNKKARNRLLLKTKLTKLFPLKTGF